MKTRSVFTLAVSQRLRGPLIGSAMVGVMLLLVLAAYREIDTSFYNELPEALRSTMGIPAGGDSALLAFGIMFSLIAPLTLASFALSFGAWTFAGEEEKGTLGLLLGAPLSRRSILTSKLAAMGLVMAAASVVVWVAGVVAPAILDTEMGSASVSAVVLHMFLNAMFYGMLAAAVGAWTGRRGVAVGVSAGVMVLSYFGNGLIPLIEQVAELAKALPWYYYDSSDPLQNGVNWAHLAVLAIGASLLAGAAFVGVERRDLIRGKVSASGGLVDRLSSNPRAAALVDRLSGGASTGSVWRKTASSNRALLVVVAGVMFSTMGLAMAPLFALLQDSMAELSESIPDNLLAFAGGLGGDLATPEGWFQNQTFGLMAPIAIMLVATTIGAQGVAGEEADRTMGLLLANPIRRSRIVYEKAFAMGIQAAIVGCATFAGVALGSVLAGLDISIANIAVASLMATLLGSLFGAFALAIGAATGRPMWATLGAAGAGGMFFVLNSVLTIADLGALARISPFNWYSGNDPLNNGIDWASVGFFVVAISMLVVLSAMFIERRDLRSN